MGKSPLTPLLKREELIPCDPGHGLHSKKLSVSLLKTVRSGDND